MIYKNKLLIWFVKHSRFTFPYDDGHWFLMVISFPHGKIIQLDSHLTDDDIEPKKIYIKMMVLNTAHYRDNAKLNEFNH